MGQRTRQLAQMAQQLMQLAGRREVAVRREEGRGRTAGGRRPRRAREGSSRVQVSAPGAAPSSLPPCQPISSAHISNSGLSGLGGRVLAGGTDEPGDDQGERARRPRAPGARAGRQLGARRHLPRHPLLGPAGAQGGWSQAEGVGGVCLEGYLRGRSWLAGLRATRCACAVWGRSQGGLIRADRKTRPSTGGRRRASALTLLSHPACPARPAAPVRPSSTSRPRSRRRPQSTTSRRRGCAASARRSGRGPASRAAWDSVGAADCQSSGGCQEAALCKLC